VQPSLCDFRYCTQTEVISKPIFILYNTENINYSGCFFYVNLEINKKIEKYNSLTTLAFLYKVTNAKKVNLCTLLQYTYTSF